MTKDVAPSKPTTATTSHGKLHVAWHWIIAIAVVSAVLWLGTLFG